MANPLPTKTNMANTEKSKEKAKSPYEYVKSFETKDHLEPGQFILVRVHCSNYTRFCEVNDFEKPYDEKALSLMNSSAISMCEDLSSIILAYGFGHEYSFILRKETDHYKRRASKFLSVMASLFTSSYRMKWTEFFPNKDIRLGALFEAEVLCLKKTSDVQAYLAFKQQKCYENKDLPEMFRRGSCILKTLVDDRKKIIVVHAENIASRAFLNSYSLLFKELTGLDENASSVGERYSDLWRVKNDKKRVPVENEKKRVPVEKQDHYIVVRIDGWRFSRSCEVNEVVKTNDEKGLNLMNLCALSVCKEFPDIILAYGFENEYSFILRKQETDHASELVSVMVSLFTSKFEGKFEGEVLRVKTSEIQAYLAFKQEECENAFGVNSNDLPDKFRLGSCILKTVVDDRQETILVHAENISSRAFLNDYSMVLSKEITGLDENVLSIGEEHLNLWRVENPVKQDGWIVVRIDGCRFSRFTKVHEFKKPFDQPAAELMNSCAMAVFEEFKDIIVYAYGQSDEYSFVLEKNTQLGHGRASKLVSAICSVFTDTYVKKWKEYLPETELQYAPRFDGRAVCYDSYKFIGDDGKAVCYDSYKLIRDYLSWRQVDCHMNTRSNTLFWARVHSGESRKRAQKNLEGREVMKEKFRTLSQDYGIEYKQLPLMFRNGSSIFWDEKEINGVKKLVVEYPDIIRDGFWEEHPHILKDTHSRLTNLE